MRGGVRAGAGRKPGSATMRTREIADLAIEQWITPLEVMLEAMRAHRAAGRLDEAAERAKEAAPYVHPRLQSVALGSKDGEPLVVQIVRFSDLPI